MRYQYVPFTFPLSFTAASAQQEASAHESGATFSTVNTMDYSTAPRMPCAQYRSFPPRIDLYSIDTPGVPNRQSLYPDQHDRTFPRLFQSLLHGSDHTEAVIYLLKSKDDIFQHYEALIDEGEPIWTGPPCQRLDLSLTPELWDALKTCPGGEERLQLVHWLSSRLTLQTNLSPSRAAYIGPPLSTHGSGRSTSSKHKSSSRTSLSPGSRRQSNATNNSDNEDLASIADLSPAKPVTVYTCRLVSQGHCTRGNFLKKGNLKNHVERLHRWYIISHPDWYTEIVVSERTKPDNGTNASSSPLPHTPSDEMVTQAGMAPYADEAAVLQADDSAWGNETSDGRLGRFTGVMDRTSHRDQMLPSSHQLHQSMGLSIADDTDQRTAGDDVILDDIFYPPIVTQYPHTGGNNNLQSPFYMHEGYSRQSMRDSRPNRAPP